MSFRYTLLLLSWNLSNLIRHKLRHSLHRHSARPWHCRKAAKLQGEKKPILRNWSSIYVNCLGQYNVCINWMLARPVSSHFAVQTPRVNNCSWVQLTQSTSHGDYQKLELFSECSMLRKMDGGCKCARGEFWRCIISADATLDWSITPPSLGRSCEIE